MRDTVYFELLEACTGDDCPVCSLTAKRVRQEMDSFLYSSVTDPSRREKIKRQHGFCNFHSRELLALGDPLAHALVYADLLEQAVRALESSRKGALACYKEQEHCLFCETAADCEKRYLAAFLGAYSHSEFAERYRAGGMLCLPHLAGIAETAGRQRDRAAVFDRLKSDTADRYRRVIGHLKEIQRKHDYRFHDEPWTDSEREAWKLAVRLCNDKTGLHR